VIHKAFSSLEFGLKKQCPLPLVHVAHKILQTLEILPSYITPFYFYLFAVELFWNWLGFKIEKLKF
jgi:hypothetical protein